VLGDRLERVRVAEPRRLVRGQGVDDEVGDLRVAGPQPGDDTRDVPLADRPGDRGEPRLDEVLLAGLQVDGTALAHELRDEGEVRSLQGHVVTAAAEADRESAFASAGPIWGSGRILSASPAPATAPGIPQTTLVASSWT
jgi:hypothetical protein